jgi:hypothetical protein
MSGRIRFHLVAVAIACLAGSSLPASVASVPTDVPVTPPYLAAQAVRSDTAVLLWRDNTNNETGFNVELKLGSERNYDLAGGTLANVTTMTLGDLLPATTYTVQVRAVNASGGSAPSVPVTFTTPPNDDCVEGPTIMCLQGGRFRVQGLFVTAAGERGEAHAVRLVGDSGYLWFFASSNIEAVVKVLDGCPIDSHQWVFAGGLTDVQTLVTVTDSMSSHPPKSYENPPGRKFQPIQDTAAFADCP